MGTIVAVHMSTRDAGPPVDRPLEPAVAAAQPPRTLQRWLRITWLKLAALGVVVAGLYALLFVYENRR